VKKPPNNPEFARFTDALKQILTVPKSTVDAQMGAEKKKRAKSKAAKPR
jgi:hypothetical protein